MKIPRVVSKFLVLAALTVVFAAAFVACGKGGSSGMNSGGGGAPAVAPRDVAISCGGGAGEATLNTSVNPVTATATLTGNQQSPPVCTSALGTATFTVDTTGMGTHVITGSIALDSIGTVTGAHIHDAEAGDAIIIHLVQNGNKWDVQAPENTLTDAQLAHFNSGSLYYNVHTNVNLNGEIRGQIGRSIYTAVMTGKQAGTASTGTGTGRVVLNPETKIADVSFVVKGLTGDPNMGHIHMGAVNVPGGVVVPMAQTLASGGTFTWGASSVDFNSLAPDPNALADLRAGNLYFNAHTAANPSGEIRGQIGRVVRFAETFSGAAQVPPVMSSGSGSGFAVLDVATRTFSASMAINNITPTAVHIHDAPAGASTTNMVVVGFTISGTTSPFSASVTNAVANATPVKEFLDDGTYMNVHTSAHADGEIRGQLDIP